MANLASAMRAVARAARRAAARAARRKARARLPRKYPGDFEGEFTPHYSPTLDGNPDPGEIVWTWVPYEEDFKRGKDRPVLLVGRDGAWLLGLMLSSKDHGRDAADEARWGRHWMDIGSGDWDSQGRPSEVRLDRVIRVNPAKVRREGAVMERRRFASVATAMAKAKGW